MEFTVHDVPDQSRYEAHADGVLVGDAAYKLNGDHMVCPHTVMEPAFDGQASAAR